MAAPVTVGTPAEKMYTAVMLQRDPQNVAYFPEPEEITSIKRMDTPSPTGGRPAPNIVFRDNVSIPVTTVPRGTVNINTQDMRSGVRYARGCRSWWMPTAWTYTAEGDDLCCCSIFAVPVLNAKKAIDHYTVYGGTLLIRNDADGRSYLYDLLDVQKKKVISKTSFSAETHSEVTSPKPSANSIPTGGGNVNSNNLSGRKAAQLATIERSNPFDPELGAHTWIRSAEDILTVQGGHRQLRRRG